MYVMINIIWLQYLQTEACIQTDRDGQNWQEIERETDRHTDRE